MKDIVADALALQELDEFTARGWVKVLSPAKVNLHLAIGPRREDGYHEVDTVLHALNLHDAVYLRANPEGAGEPNITMVARGGVELPDIASSDNIAYKAVMALAERCKHADTSLDIRIEKSIPAQAGLGGGSSNAAAALVGAAQLWDVSPDDPVIEEVARTLGADVAFFLHGGCAYFTGAGDVHVRDLTPSRKSIALVKPSTGVSTAAAYRTFDETPSFASPDVTSRMLHASSADELVPFNNLAAAAETIMPELAEIRSWLLTMPGVSDALLCGSGSCTFAICDDFSSACSIVASARKRGLWARTTSFGGTFAMVAEP